MSEVDPAHRPATPSPAASQVIEAPREDEAAEPDLPAATEVDPFDALADELRELEPDPPPEHTTNDKHYLVSNERRLDLFRPEIDEHGGLILGVGTDQHYVMAGWSRAELVVVVDFDQQVVDLHAIHGALMGRAPTVEEFRRLWSEEGHDDAVVVLREAFRGARRTALLELYEQTRPIVDERLRVLARRYRELGIHSYLDTPDDYRHVADLHARGRVVALRGDFTIDGVLREVADRIAAHDLVVDALYLSNIEQYFSYRKAFKANMLAIPFDEGSVVLRTLPARPAGFHYIVQRGEDFQAWMRTPRVWSVYRIRGFTREEPLMSSTRFVAGPPPDDGEREPTRP